jgi:hypothetical protein
VRRLLDTADPTAYSHSDPGRVRLSCHCSNAGGAQTKRDTTGRAGQGRVPLLARAGATPAVSLAQSGVDAPCGAGPARRQHCFPLIRARDFAWRRSWRPSRRSKTAFVAVDNECSMYHIMCVCAWAGFPLTNLTFFLLFDSGTTQYTRS